MEYCKFHFGILQIGFRNSIQLKKRKMRVWTGYFERLCSDLLIYTEVLKSTRK